MEKTIQVTALKVEQPYGVLYVFKISGRKLLEISSVSRRADNHREGIQRILKKSRLKRIGKFIASDIAMFPNSIIVNIDDGNAKFTPSKVSDDIGSLEFSGKTETMWIVDGQHRLNGFNPDLCNEEDFEVIVTALLNAEKEQCATLFYKINKEAKRIDPNLAYDLLDLIGDNESPREYKLHQAVKKLEKDNDSPFKGMIRMTDDPEEEGSLTQAAIINKLKWFLKKPEGEIFENGNGIDEQNLLKLIKTYFEIIQGFQKEAWDDEEAILTKGVGFGALMKLLPSVLREVLRTGRPVTKEILKRILEPIKDIDFSTAEGHDEFRGLQGEQGMDEIKDRIEEELNLTHSDDVMNL